MNKTKKVYLDYAATTPLCREALEAMHDWDAQYFGNPSSIHSYGRQARIKLEEVRDKLAAFLDCPPSELFFTSGGTEANNTALRGVAGASRAKGQHIIVSAAEHASVRQTARWLARNGFDVTFVKPGPAGCVSVGQVEAALRSDTVLVSIIYVNNETGIVSDVAAIGELCRKRNIVFHTDAVQAFTKLDTDVSRLPVDIMTLSAHKIYGPKGVAVLYVRKGLQLEALMTGGGQEANRRPGTPNVTGIIGFGAALPAEQEISDRIKYVNQVQHYFETALLREIPQCRIIGKNQKRSPYITCAAFPGISSDTLLMKLDLAGIAVSVGSACSSGSITRSHVLTAMDLDDEIIDSSLRFSFSHLTTTDELDYTIGLLKKITGRNDHS